MANVELRSVRTAYGAAGLLHGVSVDVKEGEFVTLVGPSGCGKSTLLRVIAGLEGITGGEIRIGGRAVNNVPPDHLPSEDVVYGVVAVVEPTGSEAQAIARRGSQSIICLFRDRALPQVGETVRVMPDVSRIHPFKESDGRRLA